MSSNAGGLRVQNLRVDVAGANVDIVADVGFSVAPGTALGIVGESGSGKTTVAMALLGFARPGTTIVSGSVCVGDIDILALDDSELRSTRGRLVSYVPQNPSRALSPGMRVGRQIQEMADEHLARSARSGDAAAQAAWTAAQLPPERETGRRYPHQLSGGQQQRVAIAMALVCEPKLIVMDEPTTGLDVLTQKRLLDVIDGLRGRRDTCIVYISHDLGVVRELVDHVAVMYGGRIMEHAPVAELFRNPAHPYTRRLLEAIPRVHRPAGRLRGIAGYPVEPRNRPPGCPFTSRCEFRVERCGHEMPPGFGEGDHVTRCWRVSELPSLDAVPAHLGQGMVAQSSSAAAGSDPLLRIDDLVAGYRTRGRLARGPGTTVAVDHVSFVLQPGQCLAVVGESGSGKTTLARCIAGLHDPFSGTIEYRGETLSGLARRRPAEMRRRIQIVFQDPDSSLNPSMTVGAIIRRPLVRFFKLGRSEQSKRVSELLERVHLSSSMASRLPRDLSGGEKQRVAIARAIAAEPELLVCDEITSALDVAVQASILELLEELRVSTAMSMLFVTHDLAVVRTIADSVLVMRDGAVRELAQRETLFTAPRDDYTKLLLAAAPDLHDGDYPRWGLDETRELVSAGA